MLKKSLKLCRKKVFNILQIQKRRRTFAPQ